MQKKAYPVGKPDFSKRKQKTLQCFVFQNGGYPTPKSCPRKIKGKSPKIKFLTKRQTFGSITFNCCCRSGDCSTTIFIFFFLLNNTSCLFRCIESFPYFSISETNCLNFQLLSILCCLDSTMELLGSYGGHVLVVDPVK